MCPLLLDNYIFNLQITIKVFPGDLMQFVAAIIYKPWDNEFMQYQTWN